MKKIIVLVSLVVILIAMALAGPVDPDNETASTPVEITELFV